MIWLLIPPLAIAAEKDARPLTLDSPDSRMRVTFEIDEQGRPVFDVTFKDAQVASGMLGLVFAGSGPLDKNLKINGTRRSSRDREYGIPVGKASAARDRHNELQVELVETSPPQRKLNIVLRVFDDGVAFRYEIPKQERFSEFVLTDELTRFTFPGEPSAHALPLKNYTTPYEAYYETLPVSKIGAKRLFGVPLLLERTLDDAKRAWIAVTEANLTDYAGMYLAGVDGEPGTLVSKLSPLPGRSDGAKVLGQAPFVSPWRVLMIADDPGRLIESHLVFHLSDPPAIEDTS
ncbi:MAG TPA: glycoside hydrolase family 97 N-terminal domain-containing protein, partial [Planctomycetaceae bacterium]|nr:glycoside hydrolase family 97 N-terminal domain-containing protein [Planctomycetaceae bacterium]